MQCTKQSYEQIHNCNALGDQKASDARDWQVDLHFRQAGNGETASFRLERITVQQGSQQQKTSTCATIMEQGTSMDQVRS